MSLLNKDTKLRDVVIPGAHNANTQCFQKNQVEAIYGMNQNLNVYELLTLGCRWDLSGHPQTM